VLRNAANEVVSTYRVWEDPKADPYPLSEERPVVRLDVTGSDEPANWAFADATPGD
jgi:hypothetical protein